MPAKFRNVRYIDLLGTFCDRTTYRPFKNNVVFYSDTHHLSPAGADLVYDTFKSDFLWLSQDKPTTK